jgi:hypothetical protein
VETIKTKPMKLTQRFWLPTATIFMIVAAPPLLAEPGNPLNDTFSVSIGGFLLDTDTEIRVDGETLNGSDIDAGRDLGLQDADRIRLDAYWRMTPRQKLRFMWFDTNAEGRRVIDRDIIFGDETFELNAEVEASIETTVMSLQYEFDFWQGENYELGGTFGIHNLGFDVGLSAEVNGEQGATSSSASADGPLPVFGLHGVYRFNEKWYLDYGLQYFQISFDEYDGSITDGTVAVVWQATEHFGFGAGWNQFRTKLEVDGANFDGELVWKYGGARIFVTASF